jgi:uncharacterized protein (TIGR00369 family)
MIGKRSNQPCQSGAGTVERKMKFETYDNCFVCGKNNPGGLRLCFEINREERTLKTTFVASPVFQGYDDVVHGGIISTLLDEAMSKLAYELGYHAVTGTLDIRFKNPAPVGQPLLVHGEIIEVRNRVIKAKARVEKEDGTPLATATSMLVRQRVSRAGAP